MTVELFTTDYGLAASRLLRDRIAHAKADDPLAPVTVVVPTNYLGVSVRRALASGDLGNVSERGVGIAGLSLLTVYRLAELLGAPALAAQGRRPASTPVIAAAIRAALTAEPGMFEAVRAHPATEEALLRVHRELSEVSSEGLTTLASRSHRAGEVVRVHRCVRRQLASGWYEEADLMAAAGQVVATGSPMLADLGIVILHLPQELTTSAAAMLRSLTQHCRIEVVAGITGHADADRSVLQAIRRLGLPTPATDGRRTPPTTAEGRDTPPSATRIISVSDAEEEVRSAVAAVIAAARNGVALERMAIVYPSPQPYARIVHEQLDAAGISYSGRAVRPLTDRLVGRWLLDLLDLPDDRWSRPKVMQLLAEAPARTDDGYLPTGSWERISRDAGVVRGRGEWRSKLMRYAAELRSRADLEENEPEPREWLLVRHRRDADAAEDLLAYVTELFDELDTGRHLGAWSALARWCQSALTRRLGGERHRSRWPEVEVDAAERVDAALDRLAGLDAVGGPVDFRIFRRTLELELDTDLGRVGELGSGLLAGTPATTIGLDLDLVAVLGLAEGVFPTHPREDSLLPDLERSAVADELRPRSGRCGDEHRQLLAALAASRSHRILTFPRGDLRRSVEHAPSRWLLDAVAALRGSAPTAGAAEVRAAARVLPQRAPWLQTVPSFAGRMQQGGWPATRQEYGLRALAGHAGKDSLARHPLVDRDARLRRGVALLRGRQSPAFTRFDGNLADVRDRLVSPTDLDHPVSATQLQAWLECPHAYFLEYVLKVRPVDSPEELLQISPLDRGTLVHDVLERWLCELLGGELPQPSQVWPPAAADRLRAIAEHVCEEADLRGVTGHPLLWRRDRSRILTDLKRFVTSDDDRRRQLGVVPAGAEWPFGMRGVGTGPVTIDLGDGRSVRVRGKIDRIDRTPEGAVFVADYKTGGDSSYQGLSDDAPLGNGTKLQLAIYGLAVREADPAVTDVTTEYWFVSTKGAFRRRGYRLTDEVVDHLRAALRLVSDGIAAGVFPQRPPEPGWSLFTKCRFCDPDELGSADRYRTWEQLRTAPELRDYVAHVEPEVLAEREVPAEPGIAAGPCALGDIDA